MTGYLPLYAELRCTLCGFYRGQHICDGDARNNDEMRCPTTLTPEEVVA